MVEIVTTGETGFLTPAGDIDAVVAALAQLDRDRQLLERMSGAASELVRRRFGVDRMVTAYYDLFARHRELYRPLGVNARLEYGSRLDRPWIPNALVRAIRSTRRASSIR